MADAKSVVGGQWLVLVAAFLGWMFDGLEMGIFPLVARPALQDMMPAAGGGDPFVGLWMGRITALFLVGAACGGLTFGWLGDRLGRVRSMALSILTYSIFTGLCYFSREPWHLGALRFVAAFGMGGEWSLGVALVMESWPPGKRPLLAGVIGAAANVGFVLIAVLGVYFKVTQNSWRWVMLAGAAPALLTFFILLVVPESERWKESTRKGAAQPVKEIFRAGLRKSTLLAIAFASIALIGTWGSVQWLPLWADQLTGGTMPQAKANTQILSGLGAVTGCLLGGIFGGGIGRRPAFFSLCLLSLFLCGFLFRAVDQYGVLFLFMVFLVGSATAAFYGWFPLYLPELFPTRVRATGQGVSYNSGRILAAVGALTQGQLVSYYGGSYARAGAVITLIYLFGLVLIWFAPETRGKPLPE
ncbi:MAG TPA: MFS transporter [Haliangiales bacterium]|nr:MFS transporter [Haliangiales bacterium]